MKPWTVLADDLTGAAEVAAFAGSRERPARVAWSVATTPPAAGVTTVLDSETRNASDDEAAKVLGELLRGLGRPSDVVPLFKKIDSTLRGPVGAELCAVSEYLGGVPVVAVPAYPRMGRTTRDGVQLHDGIPVAHGPAGQDPVTPARTSDVCDLLPPGPRVRLAPRRDSPLPEAIAEAVRTGRHVVIDAADEADLTAIAAALTEVRPPLIAGTGGIARHLWPQQDAIRPTLGSGTLLVIVGSRHPASRDQARWLLGDDFTAPRTGTLRRTAVVEHPSRVLVLATPERPTDPEEALRGLGDALEEVVSTGRPAAVFVTGGQTALHVLRRLHAGAVDVVGELVPGIPVGRIVGGLLAGTLLATKAGGFGRPGLVEEVVACLSGTAASAAAE